MFEKLGELINYIGLFFIQPFILQKEEEVERESMFFDNYSDIHNRLIQAIAVNTHSLGDTALIESLEDTALDYIQLLRRAKAALLDLEDFPREELRLRNVKVCNFYRDSKGSFVSVPVVRGQLLNEMLSFVQCYQGLSKKARSGRIEYAFRRSLTIMINIDQLSDEFVFPRLE